MKRNRILMSTTNRIENRCRGLEDEDFETAAAASARSASNCLNARASTWRWSMCGCRVWTAWTCCTGSNSVRIRTPVVVMISGHGSIEAAVRRPSWRIRLSREAADDREGHVVVRNAIEQRHLRLECANCARWASKLTIIGDSVPMKALRNRSR